MVLRLTLSVYIFCVAFGSCNFIGDSETILESDLDSDAFLDSFELLTKYGNAPEKHTVKTEDGYLLTLFRIPRDGPPVILAHGVTDSSDEWLVLGPKRSLAYKLANKGFDVWLYNCRGNRYSKQHQENLTQKTYWDFSYEEMGTRDLPASIDYILNATSRQKLSYVGFSQGTVIFFVLCSMKPEYNNKIAQAVLLAPVAWVSHIKFPFIQFVSENIDLASFLTTGSGLHELLPFDSNKAFSRINCYQKYSKELCLKEYIIGFGLQNASYFPQNKMAIIDSHLPAGVSAKTLIHYVQGYKSKQFQRFDYGKQMNIQMYSSHYPPSYNLSLITAPVKIIASEIDWLSQVEDVKVLKENLPNIKKFMMLDRNLQFSHLEFVFGSRVNKLINKPLIQMLLESADQN